MNGGRPGFARGFQPQRVKFGFGSGRCNGFSNRMVRRPSISASESKPTTLSMAAVSAASGPYGGEQIDRMTEHFVTGAAEKGMAGS